MSRRDRFSSGSASAYFALQIVIDNKFHPSCWRTSIQSLRHLWCRKCLPTQAHIQHFRESESASDRWWFQSHSISSRTYDDYQDLQNVLDWLSPINHRITQNDTFSKHTAGTGTWFIEHPKFQKWLSNIIPVLCAKGPREHLTCHYFPVAKHSIQRVSGRLFFRESSPSHHHLFFVILSHLIHSF